MKDLIGDAKAASKAKDWRRAAELWAKVLESGTATAPVHIRLAEALRHEGRLDAAERICRQGLEQHPQTAPLHLQLCETLYAAGRLEEAMASFEDYGRMVDDQAGGGLAHIQRLTALHKKLKVPKAEVKASWARAAGELSQQANACREALKSGGYPRARAMFVELLTAYEFDRDETRDIWLSAFDTAFSSEPVSASVTRGNSSVITGRKLMVSGMGWSGSGAILDYFRENAQVNTILREYRHIEGQAGVKHLRANMTSNAEFMNAFADFFFLTLLGLGNSLRGDKDTSLSKQLSLGEHGQSYARQALLICADVRQGQAAGQSNAALVREVSNGALDAICIGHMGAPKETAMFDNMIHIYNVDAVPVIDDLSLFCAFRDPRSNYVALLRESRRFAKNVESFVRDYRKRRQQIDVQLQQVEADLRADDTTTTRVHTVQFEEFVLSRACRQDLARKAGLDFAQHDEYALFRPWESRKNVFLHETYENPDEIAYIERELPEYCVDLAALDARADDDTRPPAAAPKAT